MKRTAEFVSFVCIAGAIHAALFWRADVGALPAAGGALASGGSVASATGDLASLIESWDMEPQSMPPDSLAPETPKEERLEASVPTDSTVDLTDPMPLAGTEAASPRPSALPTEADPVRSAATVQAPETPALPPLDTPLSVVPTGAVQPSRAPPTRPQPPSPTTGVQAIEPPPQPEPEPDTSPAPVVAVAPVAKPKRLPQQPAARRVAQPRQQQPTRPAKPANEEPEPPVSTATAQAPAGESSGQAAPEVPAVPEGQGGAAQATSYAPAAIASARAEYMAAVQQAISRHRHYPRRAKRRRITGEVKVVITLSASGDLITAAIVGSSGADILDEAALQSVKAVGRYPEIPPEMNRDRAKITVPIRYKGK